MMLGVPSLDSLFNDWAEVTFWCHALSEHCYQMTKAKGFWEPPHDNTPSKIALMHSELSEALEDYRAGKPLTGISISSEGKPSGFPIELADVVLRILDVCGRNGINLDEALRLKLKYNAARPHKHGEKLC